MGRLDGKVASITGATSGQCPVEAKLFAKEEARVVITGRQEEPLQQLLEEIEGDGGNAIYIMHDITSEADWKKVVQKTVKVYGALHILVNNAGIFMAGNTEETTLED